MKTLVYIIAIILGALLCYNAYNEFVNPSTDTTDTLRIIDSVFVEQEPETLIVTRVETKWYKIYPDTNLIKNLQDSLTNLHISYENFKKSLENDSIFSLKSDTVFYTGDSLQTEVLLWAKNDSLHGLFKYAFFPAPEKTLVAIPPGYYKKPWVSVSPYLRLYFSSSFEISGGTNLEFPKNDIIFNIEEKYSAVTGWSLGIGIGKRFDFQKPKLRFNIL